jgi:hypothetical protein
VADNDAQNAIREELQLVDEELADLRRQAADIRRRIGDTPGDAADRAVQLTEAEELEAITATLEGRRRDLLERLGDS